MEKREKHEKHDQARCDVDDDLYRTGWGPKIIDDVQSGENDDQDDSEAEQ